MHVKSAPNCTPNAANCEAGHCCTLVTRIHKLPVACLAGRFERRLLHPLDCEAGAEPRQLNHGGQGCCRQHPSLCFSFVPGFRP